MYTQSLQEKGHTNVLNFKGSILAWTLAGGELHCKGEATKQVHTHSKKFNLVGEGYEGVW